MRDPRPPEATFSRTTARDTPLSAFRCHGHGCGAVALDDLVDGSNQLQLLRCECKVCHYRRSHCAPSLGHLLRHLPEQGQGRLDAEAAVFAKGLPRVGANAAVLFIVPDVQCKTVIAVVLDDLMLACVKRAETDKISFRRLNLQDCRPMGVTTKLDHGHTETREATGHASEKMISQVYDRRKVKVATPAK